MPTERVERDEFYGSMREQRYGGLLALAWELGRPPLQREVADLLGVSRSYAASISRDLDGSIERKRKARYAGVCEKCGGPTDGSNGRAKAPKVCMGCLMVEPRAPSSRWWAPTPIWNEEKCLDSLVRWVERNGRIPRVSDLLYAEPGERPCFGTIVKYCYRYSERKRRTKHWRTDEWENWVERRLTRNLRDILVELAPRLPVTALLTARNAWLRMRLFEVVGIEQLVQQAGRRFSSDEIGVLWQIEQDDWPEPVMMVEVVNSTPEPDGTFKTYYLRVPPETRTPREGVAWTFEMDPDDYEVAVAT